jgi:predicted component of type VI protein secretion system
VSLAKMIAAQKAKAEGVKTDATPPASDVGTSNPAVDSAVSDSVDTVPVQPVPARPVGLKLGGLKLGAKTPATPAPTPQPKPESKTTGPMTLDDIASDESLLEDLPVTNTSDRGRYAFADEIPCTAPTRELPEELTSGMKEFVQQLDSIYEVVHDPELFGGMIRTIMQEMQENPDYVKLMADEDMHTMIRGLRSSMGLAKIKKAEKSKTTRGSKKAPAATAMAATADEIFNASDW